MAIDKAIAEKMVAEDTWLGSESAIQLMPVIQPSDIPVIPEASIAVAEIETVKHDNSPALHFLLGKLYQEIPRELSDEFKLTIEKRKLAEEGREYLLDYGKRPVTEISASLPHQGMNMGENIIAAMDYLKSHNIAAYLNFNNKLRTYHHLEKSLDLSGKNPTVFKRLIEPFVMLYMAPFAIEVASIEYDYLQKTGHRVLVDVPVLIALFNDTYKAAKIRVERNI